MRRCPPILTISLRSEFKRGQRRRRGSVWRPLRVCGSTSPAQTRAIQVRTRCNKSKESLKAQEAWQLAGEGEAMHSMSGVSKSAQLGNFLLQHGLAGDVERRFERKKRGRQLTRTIASPA